MLLRRKGNRACQNKHVLTAQQKELLQVFTPVASACVAIVGIVVAVWLSILQRRIQDGQRKIQEAQLKNSLYDRRFAVYEGSGEYLARLMQKAGDLDLIDLQWYAPFVEKGELLFGPEVAGYLKELQNKAGDAYAKTKQAKHKDTVAEFGGTEDHLEVNAMLKDFCGPMLDRRKTVFYPYLKLEG
jgi:hypothetical protein